MRKLFLSIIVLTLGIGAWAQQKFDNVKYLDANGVEQTANNVTEITNVSATLRDGWYVVYGADVQTGTLVYQDDVHLILADGAKLTATGSDDYLQDTGAPGIQVSGIGNSLTIYGQAGQAGQLIAKGGYGSAGIGSKQGMHLPTNITINGGIVFATGAVNGAGIGGGSGSEGSHITINGGFVTAIGKGIASGIGGGYDGKSSDIYVATNLVVKADQNNPPTTVIENDGTDLASKLDLLPYVTVDPGSLDNVKTNAIAAINAAVEGVTDAAILAIANAAIIAINDAETVQDVIFIKAIAFAEIKAKLLSYARIDAIAAINAAAVAAKAEIDAASSYPAADATKEHYKEEIDSAVASAAAEINSTSTVADVDARRSIAVLHINNIKGEAIDAIDSINELEDAKVTAINEINNARQGILNAELNALIDDAINAINNATTLNQITEREYEIFIMIGLFRAGKAEALGTMGEPCTDCPAVEVTKGDKTIKLYNPEKVEFKKE